MLIQSSVSGNEGKCGSTWCFWWVFDGAFNLMNPKQPPFQPEIKRENAGIFPSRWQKQVDTYWLILKRDKSQKSVYFDGLITLCVVVIAAQLITNPYNLNWLLDKRQRIQEWYRNGYCIIQLPCTIRHICKISFWSSKFTRFKTTRSKFSICLVPRYLLIADILEDRYKIND